MCVEGSEALSHTPALRGCREHPHPPPLELGLPHGAVWDRGSLCWVTPCPWGWVWISVGDAALGEEKALC